ncbi:hypothetical protein Tco_1211946 [Tanacetum coccineum]
MGDEHLSTIPETESDELIKSSVENLVPTPSEFEDLSKDLSDIERECNVPVCDDFTTVSNPLFDAVNDFSSISSPKFDSLLEEFSDELAHIDLISPKINEADFDPEEEIRLVEKLLYDKSSPRPPEEFNSKNSDAVIESLSPSPILVEGSDSLMEEIDLFLTPDDSMPLGIENDGYDSEGDILFLEELLSNDSPSLPENESFHFDVSSSPRPPVKPPDDGIYFEPDTGLLTAKVMGIGSSNSVRRSKSKDNKLKNTVLKNTKSSSAYVWKTSSSASLDSNKCETKDSNVCQTNECVSCSKTLKACVNAVNDGSNIVWVSCGKDVFSHSHEKYVARNALTRNSSVKRALFTTPTTAKSNNLGTNYVVAKSRLSVVNTPKATNKVSSALPLSLDSS